MSYDKWLDEHYKKQISHYSLDYPAIDRDSDNYWELRVIHFNKLYNAWHRRLWRWCVRMWRRACAWVVEEWPNIPNPMEDDDELRH